ncbi:MAG: NADH:ubiquinone reductase (Na(+)-transporting) subunit B [Candidatus Marinimicrobia bacterium]|nr:NADH:ubiquinone reductase (Na(+)-transporting) subunit B [Candidatus Neomarinimicrobiota bacterium]
MLRFLQKFKTHFEEKGKLHRFYPVYEMVEAILFVPPARTQKGAHVRDAMDMKRVMFLVVIAGVPAFLFGIFNTGYQHFLSAGLKATTGEIILKGLLIVLPIYMVTLAVGAVWEILFAVVRRHDVYEGFLVTSFLIPMILPPTIPLWQVAVATSFGIVIGKEVFGGVGMNIFNPALVTRAFLFFAYPKSISGDSVWTLFSQQIVDTYTTATPLAVVSEVHSGTSVSFLAEKGYSFWQMFLGLIPGSIGETSTLAILGGAAFLIITDIASWRIMLGVFLGGFAITTLFNILAPNPDHVLALPFHYQAVMGGFAFGAVFMATDPVSAADTNLGKYIYGFLIGVLALVIRNLNPAYPEGMMLAILLMNLFAPLIDYFVVSIHKKRRMKRAR